MPEFQSPAFTVALEKINAHPDGEEPISQDQFLAAIKGHEDRWLWRVTDFFEGFYIDAYLDLHLSGTLSIEQMLEAAESYEIDFERTIAWLRDVDAYLSLKGDKAKAESSDTLDMFQTTDIAAGIKRVEDFIASTRDTARAEDEVSLAEFLKRTSFFLDRIDAYREKWATSVRQYGKRVAKKP